MSAPRKGLMLRLPADLHVELVGKAEEQGVSLNQLLVALLAGSVRFSLKKPRATQAASGDAKAALRGGRSPSPGDPSAAALTGDSTSSSDRSKRSAAS